MTDWSFETLYRDLQHRPLGYPLLKFYSSFMDIKRGDKMPFYIIPAGEGVVSFEDRVIPGLFTPSRYGTVTSD